MYDKDIQKIINLFDTDSSKEIVKVNEILNPIIIQDNFLIKSLPQTIVHHCTSCKQIICKDNKSQLCILCYKKSHKVELKCSKCDTIISKACVKGLCVSCLHQSNRKVERPSYEQLQKDLYDSNYRQVGKKYGVSDNAIRKWIKNYKKNEEVATVGVEPTMASPPLLLKSSCSNRLH